MTPAPIDSTLWDTENSYERVTLRNVHVSVRLGITKAERGGAQTVAIDLDLFRHRGAFTGESIADCLDYHKAYRFLMALEKRPHTDLLESLLEEIAAFCLSDTRIEACRVRVRKPDVYPGHAVSGVEIYRTRAEQPGPR